MVAMVVATAAAEPPSDPLADCAPKSLPAAINCLDKHLPMETKAKFVGGSFRDVVLWHHGLGTWIRNNWGLWGGGPLRDDLQGLGLSHPDDMSGVILETYWLQSHQCPIQVPLQVAYYRAYWDEIQAAEKAAKAGHRNMKMPMPGPRPNLDCTAGAAPND